MDNGHTASVPTTAQSTQKNASALSPLGHAIAQLESPALRVLDSLKQAIWGKRPVLKDLMQTHGSETLYEYTRGLHDIKPVPSLDARKTQLVRVVQDLLAKRLGSSVAEAAAMQLIKFPLVSTTDHHAFIQHPFWVNAEIVSGLPIWECPDSQIQFLLVFSFANVSMNNASGYPRGLLFHGGVNGSGNLIRLPLFPDKDKMSTVWAHRKFTADDLVRLEESLDKKVREGVVVPERAVQVHALIQEFLAHADVLSAADLNEQITKINYRLWPRLFHHMDRESLPLEARVPGLLYLEIETLVSELLLRHHLNDSSSYIYKLIFDAKTQDLVKKHFNGIPGAFSETQKWGTYHCWGIDARGQRVGLRLSNGKLVSADGSFSVDLKPKAIEAGLKNKTLMPAMSLCYATVALHYGFSCLGGFCQIHDLRLLQRAYQAILNESNEAEEAIAVGQVDTGKFGGDGLVLAYFRSVQGGLVPATGIDMAVEHVRTLFADYVAVSKNITFEEAMNPLVPEMYTVLFPSDQRDPRLLTITPEQILRDTGLQTKLEKAVEAMEKGSAPVLN